MSEDYSIISVFSPHYQNFRLQGKGISAVQAGGGGGGGGGVAAGVVGWVLMSM